MQAKNLGMAKTFVKDVNKYRRRSSGVDRYTVDTVRLFDKRSGQKHDAKLSFEAAEEIANIVRGDLKKAADLKVKELSVKLDAMGICNYMDDDL